MICFSQRQKNIYIKPVFLCYLNIFCLFPSLPASSVTSDNIRSLNMGIRRINKFPDIITHANKNEPYVMITLL